MYSNVGGKIKTLAKVLAWFWLIVGAIAWLYLIFNDLVVYGWISLGIGILEYIASWFTYGFGQLVEDVHEIRNKPSAPAAEQDELPDL